MKMSNETYFRKDLLVSVQSQSAPDMRVMRGKGLYDAAAEDFKFVENAPRGARSVEVGRTAHSRFVRRPDGLYTLTFRFDADSKFLRESLVAEVSEIVKIVKADAAVQKAARVVANKKPKEEKDV